MSRADTWMPLYVADYLRDTTHLSAEEHGAYLLLLMGCWTRGGALPAEDGKLAAIARMAPASWKRSRATIMEFFTQDGDGWTHKRVAAELKRTAEISERRRQAGAKGGEAKAQNASKPLANAKQTPQQKPRHAGVAPPSHFTPPSEEVSDANASSVASPKADDAQTAFDAWNELASKIQLPVARKLDTARRRTIAARLADGGLEAWTAALEAVAASDLCRGLTDRGWRADLDFVCQPKSWRRLLEGSYGPKPVRRKPSTVVSLNDEQRARFVRRWRQTGEDWNPAWGEKPEDEAAA